MWQQLYSHVATFHETSMLYLFISAGLISLIALGLWRRYVSDIADVPGPLLASVSRVWNLWRLVKGDIDQRCIALHERHGMHNTVISILVPIQLTSSKGHSSGSVMTKSAYAILKR